MRFKQALSRKLAAALSAVMILSTIAPTSVPVLAAAPDDVLVDSNVEYDLQDAGSEDVLLDSAESSLAEETDTLEVAGEELLAPETASDEVLVDSAEEVLSEETGIEPVEVVEPAETAVKPSGEWYIPIRVSSNGVIKTVSWNYYYIDSTNSDAVTLSDGSVHTITAGSSPVVDMDAVSKNGMAGIVITGIELNDRFAGAENDGSYNIHVSANQATTIKNGIDITAHNDTNLDNLVAVVDDNNVITNEASLYKFDFGTTEDSDEAVYFEDKQTAFSGKLKLKVTSANIVKKIQSDHTGSFVAYDVSDNSVKEYAFTNQESITLKVLDNDEYRLDKTDVIPLDAYTLSVSNAGKKELFEVGNTGKTITLTEDADVTVEISTDVKPEYKTGKLTINVLSQNNIGLDGVLSINGVTYQLGDYAIKWDDTAWVADRDSVVSASNISNWNGKIEIPYTYAKDVKVKVSAEDGNRNNTRYQFKIGDKQVKYNNDATITLNGTTNQEISILPVQVEFDTRAQFDVTSNNLINSFKIQAFNKNNHVIDEAGNEESASYRITIDNFAKAYKDIKNLAYIEIDSDYVTYVTGYDSTRGSVLRTTVNGVTKTVNTETDHKVKYEVDASGQLPRIAIEQVANVKVSVSVNDTKLRPQSDKISAIAWQQNSTAGSGASGTISGLTSSTYSGAFYVEKDAVVSINSITATQNYLFPTVDGKVQDDLYESPKWTLGAITEDKDVALDVNEYSLSSNSVFVMKPSISGTVEISAFDETATSAVFKEANSADYSLSNNHVFADKSSANYVEFTLKFKNASGKEYSLDRIKYTYPTQNGVSENIIRATSSPDPEGKLNVQIPKEHVKKSFLKDGKFEFDVVEYENSKQISLALVQDPSNSIKEATVAVDGEYVLAIGKSGYSSSGSLNYGSPLVIQATPNPGYKLVSVNIATNDPMSTASGNNINITDAKKIALVTGAGYTFEKKFEDDMTITFTCEPIPAATVEYADGTDKTVYIDSKTKNYTVSSKRDVVIKYFNGAAQKNFDYDVLIGKTSIFDKVSTNGVKKDGTGDLSYLTFKGSDENLIGKIVTIKLFKAGGSASDADAVTLTLAVGAANAGVTFKPDEVSMPLGTKAEFKASVIGNVNVVAVVSGCTIAAPAPEGMTVTWTSKNKALSVETKANSALVKTHVINLVDAGDVSVVYGSIKVKVETDTVKNAPAVVAKVTGTTNHKITLSLKANKVDVKTDGLYYRIDTTVKAKEGKTLKGYYENKTDFVPVSETSFTVDVLKQTYIDNPDTDAAKVASRDSDENAEFSIEIKLVQKSGATKANNYKDGSVIVTQENKCTIDSSKISMKEGYVFETNLKLKKGTKGNVWTTYSAAVPYVINVVYSKNTGVQEYSKVELLDADGTNHPNNFEADGTYSVKIKPDVAGSKLAAGNYTLKVYALEPDGMDVVATMKFKVVQAIESIRVNGAPEFIYKQAGKAAKAEVKAYDITAANPKAPLIAKKVIYSIVDADNATGKEPAFVTNKMITIGKNNGKISIKKDFTIDKTEFYVKVVTNDNTSNPKVRYSPKITVKTTAASNIELAYKPNGGNFDCANIYELGSSYYAGQLFHRYDNTEKYEYVAYITVYDKAKNATAKAHFVPATIKVSGAGKLLKTYVDNTATIDVGNSTTRPTVAVIGLKKVGDIKINVTADDGSGRVIKNKVIKVNNVPGTVGFTLYDPLGGASLDQSAKTLSFNNYAPLGEKLELNVYGVYKDNAGVEKKDYIEHKISVKDGKLAKVYKNGMSCYTIEPKASKTGTTVVTLSNKNKSGLLTITIYNKAIAASTSKVATKVTAANTANGKAAKGKIYNSIDFRNTTGFTAYADNNCNKVTYTLSGVSANYALVNVVKDDDDNTILNQVWKASQVQNGGTALNVDGNTYAIPLTKSAFYIDYAYSYVDTDNDGNADTWVNGVFSIKKGSYKITITPANQVTGTTNKYDATGKSVTLTVNAASAPKASVKPKNSVTFSGKTGTIDKGNPKNYIAINKGNYVFDPTDLRGVNNKGKINHFKEYFTLDATGKLTFTGKGTKTSLNPKDKNDKLELSGYVPYKYQSLDGVVHTDYVKVSIKATGTIQ